MGSAVHDFVATARDFSDTKRETAEVTYIKQRRKKRYAGNGLIPNIR